MVKVGDSIVVIERKWEVCFRVLCQIRGRSNNIYKLYNCLECY